MTFQSLVTNLLQTEVLCTFFCQVTVGHTMNGARPLYPWELGWLTETFLRLMHGVWSEHPLTAATYK
jgi:hypothetical protein